MSQTQTELLPPKLRDLFFRLGLNGSIEYIPSRYKVAHGGRGSAKSWGFATVAVILACARKLRVLCAREVQASIRDSIYRLLCDRIHALGLAAYFDIQREGIFGPHGSEFTFAGIKSDPNKIKSAEGIDICLVEEAHKVTDESWSILIPTIRKAGSEIWVTFNPTLEEHSTYKRFILETPPDCRRVEINWNDNPWFPDALDLERLYDLQRIANANDAGGRDALQAHYDHVWNGKILRYPVGSFFSLGSFLEDGKPVPNPVHPTWIFATVDTANKSGRQHDGCGVVYWAVDHHEVCKYPLYILDWDYRQIDGALLIDYLPTIYQRIEELAAECQVIRGTRGVHIEDKASGMVLLQQAANLGLEAYPLDGKLTAMGKIERGINVSGYVHQGQVKFTEHAFARSVTYKGINKNHLVSQLMKFTASVIKPKADEAPDPEADWDDLLDAACYGIAKALGNPDGF